MTGFAMQVSPDHTGVKCGLIISSTGRTGQKAEDNAMSDADLQAEHDLLDSRLAESEARYRAVIENASDMIQSVRPDGTFEFVNRTWLEKLGYAEDEVADLIVWDIIHPESVAHCQEFFGRAIGGETIEDLLAVFITKNGQRLPVEGNATSRFQDGQVIATHSFFRDITERLRAQELEEKNRELEREKLARYLEKMAALGKLSAGLAHELNNPAAAAQRAGAQLTEASIRLDAALAELQQQGLTAEQWQLLRGFFADFDQPAPKGRPTEISRLEDEMEEWLEDNGVEDGWELAAALVQEGVKPKSLDALIGAIPAAALKPALTWLAESGTTKELADVVTRSTQRISDLVAAVKAYTYMDRAIEQVVDIHDGLETTLVIFGHRLRNMTINREYDRSLPQIRALGSGLNQVWTNILDNALDAVEEQGTITIRTKALADDRIAIEIEDDGPGIPEEHLTRVFEPFFSTKAQGEGTGLGLDTVWRIVTEEHDGAVEVESRPGRTLFRVTLPVRAATVQ
jgi:PAS domain S-box-containing protein